MRIAHICLAQFYIDGFGYQENILPRVHRRMGHDVEIITSTETYIDQTRLGYVAPASYVNEDGIPVHRLPYARWVPRKIQPKIRAYRGLKQSLETFQPDLIFLHDLQFWDLLVVRKYALAHNIPVHADSHTDFVISARGFVSRHLLPVSYTHLDVYKRQAFVQGKLPRHPQHPRHRCDPHAGKLWRDGGRA